MKNKKKFRNNILIIAICLFIFIFFIFLKDKKIEHENLYLRLEKDNYYTVSNSDNLSILEDSYQNDIDKLIFNKKNDKIYTANNPLLILNPYGTNLTGLYIYFYTIQKTKIEYTISVSDTSIPDFTNTLPDELVRKHEGQIIGLIQGMENTIRLRIIDKDNSILEEYEYKINIPDYNTNSIKVISSNKLVEENQISDGLYMICVISNSAEFDSMPLSFYDKNGVLRAEFTKKSGNHTQKLITIKDKILYSIDANNYALVNRNGKIEKKYYTDYRNNHDYIYSEFNNSILYVTGTDYVRRLDLSTSKDYPLLDLNIIMKSYRDKALEYYKENSSTLESDNFDWAHLNNIEIVNNTDLILSLRENSSIIYLSDIYDNPTIKYIIAPERIYEGTEYSKYLLKQIGEFPIHAGQHTVLFEDNGNLNDNKYYLYFFNNNYAKSETVFNSDWVNTIEGAGSKKTAADYSMYYKYLIDEDNKTFTLIDSLNVTYSNAKSNVQIYEDGNYISTSGKKAVIQEFDCNKKPLLELRLEVYDDIYRAYKVNMKNFWFGSNYNYTEIFNNNNPNSTNSNKKENNSDFNYNKNTNTILGINSDNPNSNESNIIYYDNLYFTIYDYNSDTLIIPNNIDGTQIKKVTGINYANVKRIIIEEGIEEIGDYAFLGCNNLEEIVLPSTLKTIGKYSFVGCKNIKILNIPENVTYIGRESFREWTSEQKVKVLKNWQSFSGTWKKNSKAKFILGE